LNIKFTKKVIEFLLTINLLILLSHVNAIVDSI